MEKQCLIFSIGLNLKNNLIIILNTFKSSNSINQFMSSLTTAIEWKVAWGPAFLWHWLSMAWHCLALLFHSAPKLVGNDESRCWIWMNSIISHGFGLPAVWDGSSAPANYQEEVLQPDWLPKEDDQATFPPHSQTKHSRSRSQSCVSQPKTQTSWWTGQPIST